MRDRILYSLRQASKLTGISRSALSEAVRKGSLKGSKRFRVHGIQYEPATLPKSDLYREALPIINAGRVELLDMPRLAGQLAGLERRVARGGRDSIDHGVGAHDDLANVVAGATYEALGRSRGLTPAILYGSAAPSRQPEAERRAAVFSNPAL